MAFPLNPTHLRAYLRALTLCNKENDGEVAAHVIRPLELGFLNDDLNRQYFRNFRPVSPPIPYDISETTPELVRLAHKRGVKCRRRTRKARPHDLPVEDKTRHAARDSPRKTSYDAFYDNVRRDLAGLRVHRRSAPQMTRSLSNASGSGSLVNTIPIEGITPSESVGTSRKENFRLFSRLFLSSPALVDTLQGQELSAANNDNSTRPQPVKRLSDAALQQLVLGLLSTAMSTPRSSRFELDESDENTIENAGDSRFSSRGYSSQESLLSETVLSCSDLSFSDASIANGSNIMYHYSVPKAQLLANENSYSSLPPVDSVVPKGDAMDQRRHVSMTSSRQKTTREEFEFEKLPSSSLAAKPHQSLLSSMINCRQELINENPLSYFTFVGHGPDMEDAFTKARATIDVFLPPQKSPVLKEVSVVTSSSVFSCIGYFISQIILIEQYAEMKRDQAFIDPNNWRMELIDNEGDLYDSTFGVLDRTRLLSSYNCPRWLAVCQTINPAEIAKNNKQTPLPLEFKQNLEMYRQRVAQPSSPNEDIYDTGLLPGNSVQVQLGNIPNQKKEYITIFIPSTMQIGGLFDLICRQYQVGPTDYKLMGVDDTHVRKSELSEFSSEVTPQEGREVALDTTSQVGELGIYKFRLVSSSKKVARLILHATDGAGSFFKPGITPDALLFFQTGITPLLGTIKDTTKPGPTEHLGAPETLKTVKTQVATKRRDPAVSQLLLDNHNFDDQFKSKSPDIPSLINTVYFKWKVFRRKPPILNRIEKLLIIDGDYIHIAPADNVKLKKASSEVLDGGSQDESKQNHHYLHHYNYSKYYNDTMMKTSSFHVSQIIKVKHFRKGKNPLQFKITIEKDTELGAKDSVTQKKYGLEAETEAQLKDILEKVEWARKTYERSAG